MSLFNQYEKALSLEWNGYVYVMTVRNEMKQSFNYLYSYDGSNWTPRLDISNSEILSSKNPYNVKWTGSEYLMMGNLKTSDGQNAILSSSDGINYSPNSSVNLPSSIFDIETNLEFPHTIKFPTNTTLAVGGRTTDTTKIAYSTDSGITWTNSSNSAAVFTNTCNNAAWNGKSWVAVGSCINYFKTSSTYFPSQITNYTSPWSASSIPYGTIGIAISGNKSIAVFCNYNNGLIYFSQYSNGTWGSLTQTLSSSVGNINCISITYDGTRIVVGVRSNYCYYATWNGTNFGSLVQTSDGTTRNYTGLDMTPDGNTIVACASNVIYYAVWSGTNYYGFNSTSISCKNSVSISQDATSIAYVNSSNSVSYATWNGSNYGTQMQTLSGTISNSDRNIRFSPDKNYIYLTQTSGSSYYSQWNGTNYGQLVPFTSSVIPNTDNCGLAISYDGTSLYVLSYPTVNVYAINIPSISTTTTLSTAPTYLPLMDGSTVYSSPLGGGNTIATSTDGIIWTGRGNYIFNTSGNAIAWSKELNLWVAGGSGGNSLAYSYDGIYWKGNETNVLSGGATDVQWNGNLWIAGGVDNTGLGGALVYSSDGVIWKSSSQSTFDITATKISWNGDVWTAIGSSSLAANSVNIAQSADGINWNMYNNPLYNNTSYNYFTNMYSNKKTNLSLITTTNSLNVGSNNDYFNNFMQTNNTFNFSQRPSSIYFNGVNQYAACTSATSYALNYGTIEFWMKTSFNTTGIYAGLIVKPNAYGIFLYNNYLYYYNYSNSTWYQTSSTIIMNDNDWHYIAFAFNTNSINVYIDGNYIYGNSAAYSIVNQNSLLYVATNAGSNFYNGYIANIRISNSFFPSLYTNYTTFFYNINASLQNGLVGYYPMNDASGTTLNNNVPSGVSMTLYNGPSWSSSISSIIDNISTYSSVSTASVYSYTTGTIEAYIKVNVRQYGLLFIAGKANAYALLLSNNYLATYNWATNTLFNTNILLNDNKWHHVAFSFNAGVQNSSYLYLDGNLVSTFTYNIFNQNSPFTIGGSAITNCISAYIANVKIWNVQLSSSYILNNYNCQISTIPTGLTGFWKMNENGGNTFYNSVPNSPNMIVSQVSNSAWTNTKCIINSFTNLNNYQNPQNNIITFTNSMSYVFSSVPQTPLLYFPFNKDFLNYATGTGVSNVISNTTYSLISTTIYKVGTGSLSSSGYTSQYLTIGNLPANQNGYTVCCWINLNYVQSGTIFSLYNSNTYHFYGHVSGGVAGANNVWSAGNYLTPGVWYHYAITMTKNSITKVYINGVIVGITTSITYFSQPFNSNNNRILGNAQNNQGLSGYVDEFLYYDGILSESDIYSLYSNSLYVPKSGLLPISSINSVNYNGTNYLMGGNVVLTNPNPYTTSLWTTSTIPNMNLVNNFAWNNPDNGTPFISPMTIAVGTGNNTISYSYDGIYWRGAGNNILSTRGNAVIWNGIMWIAVGNGNYWVATSYDGISWMGRNNSILTEAYDIAWNGKLMIAVGETTSGISFAMSYDGITWSPLYNSIFSQFASSINWTGNCWIASGSGGNTTAYSNDGLNWFPTKNPNLLITNATRISTSPGVSSINYSSTTQKKILLYYPFEIDTYNYISGVGVNNTSLYNGGGGDPISITNSFYRGFNGVGCLASTGGNNGLQISALQFNTNAYSISFWFYLNSSSDGYIFSMTNATNPYQTIYAAMKNNVLTIGIGSGIFSTITPTTKTWYNINLIIDRKTFYIYINQNLYATYNSIFYLSFSLDNIYIFGSPTTVGINGYIDHFIYMDGTISNFNNLFNNQTLAYYPFNGNISNYATGSPVLNSTIFGSGISISNSIYKTGSGSLYSTSNSSYIQVGTYPANVNGYTFSCWFYLTSSSYTGMLYSFSYNQSTRIFCYFSAGILQLGSSGGTNVSIMTPNVSTWYHLTWTLNSSSQSNVYINGVLNSTFTSLPYFSSILNNNRLMGDPVSATGGFLGYMDDFLYYDGILSSQQISGLYVNSTNNNFDVSNVLTTISGINNFSLYSPISLFNISGGNFIVYYPFDKNTLNYKTMTGVSDSSLNNVSGTFGISTSVSKYGGGSLYSSTNSNYLQLSSYPANISGYSFSFWFYLTSTSYTGMLMTFNNANPRIFCYMNNGVLQVGSSGTATTSGTTIFTPTISTWYHVVWTMTTSSQSNVYINGILSSSFSTQTYFSSALNNNRIMGDPNSATGGFIGYMDEFIYYDGIFTPSQVSLLSQNYTSYNSSLNTYNSLINSSLSYDTMNLINNNLNSLSNNWYSAIYSYSSITGINNSNSSTPFYNSGNTYTASGEFIQVNLSSPVVVVYYQLSWFLYQTVQASLSMPREWYLLGSNDANNWYYIDYFNFGNNNPPSGSYYVKLQNIYANTVAYKYYRFIFPRIFINSYTNYSNVYLSGLDLFSANANSTQIDKKLKPIITKTHIIYPTNIVSWPSNIGNQILYLLSDLNANYITTGNINNGNYVSNIINGYSGNMIYGNCFDGQNYYFSTNQGNVLYISNNSSNTNLFFDVSFNGNGNISTNISGNTNCSCFNGKRIIFGGDGSGNIITYNTISNNPTSNNWNPCLNVKNIMTSVLGINSNSGYGSVYVPNKIYFNPGEKVSIIGPKTYSTTSNNAMSVNLFNSNIVSNITLPTSTELTYILGPTGITGPALNIWGPEGVEGYRNIDYGPTGTCPYGETGSMGQEGLIGEIGNFGNTGETGSIGTRGSNGIMGFQGNAGTTGDTGSYGPTGEFTKNWFFTENEGMENGLYTTNNIIIGDGPTGNANYSLKINSDKNLKTNLEIKSKNHFVNENSIIKTNISIGENNKEIINSTPFANAKIYGNVEVSSSLKIGVGGGGVSTVDISGNAFIKSISANQISKSVHIPLYQFPSKIEIDYKMGNVFYVLIDDSIIEQNFATEIVNFYNNIPDSVLYITLVLDYKNCIINRYYSDSLRINNNSYNSKFTGGNPILNTLTTKLIQEFMIIVMNNSIIHVACKTRRFE